MGPVIARTLVSFGVTDGRQLVFSLEIRKERHEAFSAIAGLRDRDRRCGVERHRGEGAHQRARRNRSPVSPGAGPTRAALRLSGLPAGSGMVH